MQDNNHINNNKMAETTTKEVDLNKDMEKLSLQCCDNDNFVGVPPTNLTKNKPKGIIEKQQNENENENICAEEDEPELEILPSNVLIVTSIKKIKMEDREFLEKLKERFESFGDVEVWRPFRNLGRIKVTYLTTESAMLALKFMNLELFEEVLLKIHLGPSEVVSFPVKQKMPTFTVVDPTHLEVPLQDKMHLISPPPSPPSDWAPNVEPIPLVDQELMSRLSGLKANEETLVHPGTKEQPSIFVLACDDIPIDKQAQDRALSHRKAMTAMFGRGLLPTYQKGSKLNLVKERTPRPPMKDDQKTAVRT